MSCRQGFRVLSQVCFSLPAVVFVLLCLLSTQQVSLSPLCANSQEQWAVCRERAVQCFELLPRTSLYCSLGWCLMIWRFRGIVYVTVLLTKTMILSAFHCKNSPTGLSSIKDSFDFPFNFELLWVLRTQWTWWSPWTRWKVGWTKRAGYQGLRLCRWYLERLLVKVP